MQQWLLSSTRQSEQVVALNHIVRMSGNDSLGLKVRTALLLKEEKSGRGIIHQQTIAVTSPVNLYHYDHLFKLHLWKIYVKLEHHEVSFLFASQF